MIEGSIIDLTIRLDIDDDFLGAKNHIILLRSIEDILENFNEKIFYGNIQYEYVSFGTDSGCFLLKIAIKSFKVIAAVSVLIGVLESELIAGFIKGLTGDRPNFEQIGENTGLLMRGLLVDFILTPVDELEKIVPQELNLDQSFRAKSDIFRTCIEYKNIKSFCFSMDSSRIVQRQNFPRHISRARTRKLPDIIKYKSVVLI